MNIAEVKKKLQKKERDLQDGIAQHDAEARDASEPEVRDYSDEAVSSEDTDAQFQQSNSDWAVLVQVREALARIEQGTYGRCIDCGRRIEPSRLAAIPWTPYCLHDQARHDR